MFQSVQGLHLSPRSRNLPWPYYGKCTGPSYGVSIISRIQRFLIPLVLTSESARSIKHNQLCNLSHPGIQAGVSGFLVAKFPAWNIYPGCGRGASNRARHCIKQRPAVTIFFYLGVRSIYLQHHRRVLALSVTNLFQQRWALLAFRAHMLAGRDLLPCP